MGVMESLKKHWSDIIFSLVFSTLVSTVLFNKANSIFFPYFFIVSILLLRYLWGRLALGGVTLVCCALLPSFLLTGTAMISSEMFLVVLTTNFEETRSYLEQTPLQNALIAGVLFLICLALLLRKGQPWGIKMRKPIIILLSCLMIAGTYKVVVRAKINTLYSDIQNVLTVKKLPSSTWRVTEKLDQSTNTYFVLLGESLRKDALSLYGNRHQTTPYLNKLPVKYIDGYVACAVNTTLSVPRNLALSDSSLKLHEENNIIALAKDAGLKTYWLTSQDITGEYNFSAGRIAMQADEIRRVKHGYDLSLCPILKKVLEDPSRKLIVMHIYGSHAPPCSRVRSEYRDIFHSGKFGKNHDCYLSSVHKTDYLISQVIELLQSTNKKFKFCFFPDHAQAMELANGKLRLGREVNRRQVDIPYIEAGSDISRTEKFTMLRSALNFPRHFPAWIGVRTNLVPEDYDIFTAPADADPDVVTYDGTIRKYSTFPDSLSLKDLD